MIGHTDQANHQYDLTHFDAAVAAGNLPQVSFLKAAAFEDGHPGYSGPLDEQRWIARVLDEVQQSPDWASTAVFVTYDDSDGWYDHVMAAITQGSDGPSDQLGGPGVCGPAPGVGVYKDRCGPGPRLPLLVVSPWVTPNSLHSTQLEQASIIRFIEDNWGLGRIGDQSFDARAAALNGMFDFNTGHARAPKVFLDPDTGNPPGAPTVTPVPTATPIVTAVPTVSPTPTATPKPPTTTKKIQIKLSCKVSGGGKKISVSCTATGADASKKTALRFRIVKGSKVLATASANLSKKKAKVTIRPKKAIKKGKTARWESSTPRSPRTACGSSEACGPASRSAPSARRPPSWPPTCHALRRTVDDVEIEPRDDAIRAHEILEDAQRACSARGRALEWGGRACHRGVAGGDLRGHRDAAGVAGDAAVARAGRVRPVWACAANSTRSGARTAAVGRRWTH